MSDELWEPAHAVPELRAGEVHVWCDATSHAAPWTADGYLTADERAQSGRMSSLERRATFVRARSCLRFLAGRYLKVVPGDVPIRILEKGKPVITSTADAPPLAVSVAHSGSTILVAFTRVGEVGVDVERIDSGVDRASIARRFFTAAEASALAALTPPDSLSCFFALWAHKEAMLKAAGDGLSMPLAEVEFAIEAGRPPMLLRVPAAFGSAIEWSVRALEAGLQMAGAVAVRGQVGSVRHLRWQAPG